MVQVNPRFATCNSSSETAGERGRVGYNGPPIVNHSLWVLRSRDQ